MLNDNTPDQLARTSPTPLPATNRGMRGVVRRARLEHLATELLRLSNALRLPVPVHEIYQNPPAHLWRLDPIQTPEHPPAPADMSQNRLETARAIARLVGESQWEARLRLMGDKPFSPGEVEIFAIALLLPTALLAGINERQRTPATVSVLFQVPQTEAAVRLAELGYLSEADRARITNRPTG